MMVLHLDQNQLQTIDQTRKVALKQHNEKTKKYRIIQTLLMISGIVLVCLGGFGVLGAGIFAGLAIGLGSFFVAGVFANIFVSASGYGMGIVNTESNNLELESINMQCVHQNINFYLSMAIALIGIALITCGAFGVIELGLAYSIGIPIFFATLGGIIVNNKTVKDTALEPSFFYFILAPFFADLHLCGANIVLLGSILTCLALGVITMLGSLNLMFAVGLMAPLIVGSVVFKIAQVVIEKRLDNLRRDQSQELASLIYRGLRTPDLNLNENNKENNQPLSENNSNGGKDFQNQTGSIQGQTP